MSVAGAEEKDASVVTKRCPEQLKTLIDWGV